MEEDVAHLLHVFQSEESSGRAAALATALAIEPVPTDCCGPWVPARSLRAIVARNFADDVEIGVLSSNQVSASLAAVARTPVRSAVAPPMTLAQMRVLRLSVWPGTHLPCGHMRACGALTSRRAGAETVTWRGQYE